MSYLGKQTILVNTKGWIEIDSIAESNSIQMAAIAMDDAIDHAVSACDPFGRERGVRSEGPLLAQVNHDENIGP